jgi:hypothetical protein
VTEYRQKTAEHTAPITVEAEHLSQVEIEDLVKELVWNYRKLYLPRAEEDKVSSEEYQKYERESELAWGMLEAAFKHRREFKPEFLRNMSDEGASDRITEQLIKWTEDLEWPSSIDDAGTTGIWRSTAETAAQCCVKTAAFMKDRLWPFTKIIRYDIVQKASKNMQLTASSQGLFKLASPQDWHRPS